MSSDSQLRKRKDNKKKRKDDEPQNEDINIHIHKEGETGGGIFAKLVFIFLSCALVVLIGLIVKENQGLNELENIESESRFAQAFEGWIEENSENHSPEVLSHENEESEETHSDEVTEEDEEIEEDEDTLEISEEIERSEEEDEEEDMTTEEDVEEDSSEPQSKDATIEESTEEEEEGGIDVVEKPVGMAKQILKRHIEQRAKFKIIPIKNKITDTQESSDDESNEDLNEDKSHENLSEDKEKKITVKDEDNDDEDIVKEESSNEDKSSEAADDEQEHSSTEKTAQSMESPVEIPVEHQEQERVTENEQIVPQVNEDRSGISTKIGVGLALLVVAYKVFLRKRRNPEVPPPKIISGNVEQLPDLSRRNTIVPPPSLEDIEPDLNLVEDQEDYSEEEEYSEEEISTEHHRSPREEYQRLRDTYSRSLTPEGDFASQHSSKEEIAELEDSEDLDYAEEEEYLEEEQSEEDIESPEDGDEELLKRLEAKYGRIGRDVTVSSHGEESDVDKKSDDEYEYSNITNTQDQRIKKELDEAQKMIKKNAAYANKLFDAILEKYPTSPRTLYGKALTLDTLADQRRSNDLLKLAVSLYAKVLISTDVPDALFIQVADRYIDRQTFLGHYKKTVPVFESLIEKYPDNRSYMNKLVVTYLTMNEIEEARKKLKDILDKWPNDGFALVHYGFILKTKDNNLQEAIDFLEKGLKTKQKDVKDGRFYYHLGDALIRLRRKDDAEKVFEEGAKEGVLLSKYQRSLYNVPNLTAKPWWSPEDIPSHNDLIQTLKSNWKTIRKEALGVLNEAGYFQDEKEKLRETGDWKQLDLFVRGRKVLEHCTKTPVTCGIIQMFPEASKCRRGQTKFSIMHPNTHVWAHCGPTNTRLRIHLGLIVPKGTFIRVADDLRTWKEGDVIIFDDSFEHEVWHNGTSMRLVLMVDVWHPDLPDSLKKNLSAI